LNIRAIEYEINGQWKVIEEEKLSRRAQREKEAYKAAMISNGKYSIDYDSDEEQILSQSTERQVSAPIQNDIPVIELDDD